MHSPVTSPESEQGGKMLNKTLTFGLGEAKAFDEGKLTTLTETQRKLIYTEILKGFGTFARLCNLTASTLYAGRVLKEDIKSWGYSTGYRPFLDKLNLQTSLNGNILGQAYQCVMAHFSGDHGKSLFKTGTMSLPTHRTDGTHPLYFHKNGTELIKVEEKYYLVYFLFSMEWATANSVPPRIAFEVKFKKKDKSGAAQLEKAITGEWQKCSCQLARNSRAGGNKYLARIVLKYEPQPFKNLLKETVMGIDLGLTVPAAIHFRTNGAPEKWAMCIGSGRDMISARSLVKREIIALLRGMKKKDSPVLGASRKLYAEKLQELRKREKRIMKTASQKIAASIAEQAKRNGAGTWQIEDLSLTDIKEGQPWLSKNWAPGVLLDALRWQATQMGAEILKVNPRYTSQRCSKCGHIASGNRPKDKEKASYFCCLKCGYTDNADKNAARNLSIEHIDEVITASLMAPNGAANS
jgi:putative transposase